VVPYPVNAVGAQEHGHGEARANIDNDNQVVRLICTVRVRAQRDSDRLAQESQDL